MVYANHKRCLDPKKNIWCTDVWRLFHTDSCFRQFWCSVGKQTTYWLRPPSKSSYRHYDQGVPETAIYTLLILHCWGYLQCKHTQQLTIDDTLQLYSNTALDETSLCLSNFCWHIYHLVIKKIAALTDTPWLTMVSQTRHTIKQFIS